MDSFMFKVKSVLSLAIAVVLVSNGRVETADQPLEWKAGIASAVITPTTSMLMAGYAARKEPSEGTEQELFAKALAIEDRSGNRVVFVTTDLIGVSGRLRTVVTGQLQEKLKLPPHVVVMNAPHTTSGAAS